MRRLIALALMAPTAFKLFKTAIAAAFGLVAALLVGGYLYASSRPETLPEGTLVAGVAVGRMTPSQARTALEADFAEFLVADRLRTRGRSFPLRPQRFRLTSDRNQQLERALREVRDVSDVARTYFGRPRGRSRPERLTVDRRAIRRFLEGAAKQVDRRPRDAQLRLTPNGPEMIGARDGWRLDRGYTATQIRRALRTRGSQEVHGRMIRVPAEIRSHEDLRRQYPAVLVANRAKFTLDLYEGERHIKRYDIAVGAAGHDTPAGTYAIANKAVDPAWHVPSSDWAGDLAGQVIPGGAANNPLKARWLGIIDGVGIHGTAEEWSMGSAASHGCLRMRVSDVIDLYPRVPVGAPILIV